MLKENDVSDFQEFLLNVETLTSTLIYKEITDTKEKLKFLLADEYIKDKLMWVLPNFIDISEELNLSSNDGKVYALSFPDVDSKIHLKTPIFAGLFLLQVMNGQINKNTEIIIEAGGINTGYGLKNLVDIFQLKGKFYTSRYLPENLISKVSSESMEIIQSTENKHLGIEEEFYMEFVQDFKKLRSNGNISPLWHVKKSFIVAEVLAEQIFSENKNLFNNIDNFISGVGSGASLAILSTLNELIAKRANIIISEHTQTPIFWHNNKNDVYDDLKMDIEENIKDNHFIDTPDNRVPHIVYGPHYEKINNKIPKKYLDNIDSVSLYSDDEWKDISISLENKGILVGNSSAANLAIAKKIALTGQNSLTFIYETKRDYIRK